MNIFNAIKYPFATVDQAIEDFNKLPEDLRKEFSTWHTNKFGSYPGAFDQDMEEVLAYLRKLVAEYHDDL